MPRKFLRKSSYFCFSCRLIRGASSISSPAGPETNQPRTPIVASMPTTTSAAVIAGITPRRSIQRRNGTKTKNRRTPSATGMRKARAVASIWKARMMKIPTTAQLATGDFGRSSLP